MGMCRREDVKAINATENPVTSFVGNSAGGIEDVGCSFDIPAALII